MVDQAAFEKRVAQLMKRKSSDGMHFIEVPGHPDMGVSKRWVGDRYRIKSEYFPLDQSCYRREFREFLAARELDGDLIYLQEKWDDVTETNLIWPGRVVSCLTLLGSAAYSRDQCGMLPAGETPGKSEYIVTHGWKEIAVSVADLRAFLKRYLHHIRKAA